MKSRYAKFAIIIFLLAGMSLQAFAQASLMQNTNAHFYKGYPNNMAVSNDQVIMPFQATAMGTWWTQTNDLPRRVQNHQAVAWNNKVYITGGVDVTGVVDGVEVRRVSPKVYSADINNGLSNYVELNDLPEGIMNHASVVANGYLYVIGGIDADSIASNRIYHAKLRADGTIRNWELNANFLPTALWGHTASFVNGYIIITGGSNDIEVNAINNVYSVKVEPDGELTTFTTQPVLGINRNQHAAAVFNNRIYIAGGYDEAGVITNTVVYTDIDLNGTCSAWQSATNLPEPLFGLTGACDQGLIVFSGGYNDNEEYSIQYSYAADVTAGTGFTWQQSSLYYEHYANSQSFIHAGKLYMLGGFNIFNVTMERVYYNTLSISATVKLTEGNFMGEVLDLGMNRQVNSLLHTGQNLAGYSFSYRTAADDESWGGWTDITDNFDIEINASLRYVQFLINVSGAETDNTLALDETELTFVATQLAGNYDTETWTLANSPYWVTDDVFINGTVEVEAGVVFTFSEGTKMQVNHILNCNGTNVNPVTFTSFSGEDGYWNGLHFSSSSNNDISTLNYVIIENAGFIGFANLNCYSTNQPTMNNAILRHSTSGALYCNDASPVFNTIDLNNNQNYLVRLERGGGPVFSDYTLTGNELEKVHVTGGNMSLDGFWQNMLTEYHIFSTVNTTSRKLVIEEGITLKFDPATQLFVNGGALWAEGGPEPENHINFTALNNEAGGWDGVHIQTAHADGSKFNYCNFSFGNEYNLASTNSSNISVENTDFSNALQSGFRINWGSSSNITVKNSNFYDNQQGGIHGIGHNHNILFDNLEIYNNGTHGFECSGTYTLINSHIYDNAQTGVRITDGGATYFEPQIENVLIENNGTNGIWVTDCFPDFINVDVLNNTEHGFLMNANVWPEYFNLNLSGNETNDLRVAGGYINRDITWEVGQHPFIVIESFFVRNFGGPSIFTLEKGLTLRFANNTGIIVGGGGSWNGGLFAVGANHPDSLITLTSLNEQPGGWAGISFEEGARESYLTHCIIENAVNNLNFDQSDNYVTIDSTVIRNASNTGINSWRSAFHIKNSQIVNNHGYGIYLHGDVRVPTIGDTLGMGNDIFGNNEYDIYNQSNLDVNARHNFFNTSDPAIIAQRIFDNADNASYGTVYVDPNSDASASPMGRFISANIFYDNSDETPMDDVGATLLNDSSEPLQTAISTSEGKLTFVGLHDHTYDMELVSEKAWGGVNATDALLVMQHFAEIITLDGIRLAAADVNASGAVNSTDALAILQRFVRITESFDAGDWAFLPEDGLVIDGVDINTTIRALCYGDVNGSNMLSSKKSGGQQLSLLADGQMEIHDNMVALPVYPAEETLVGAVSLKIAYPHQYITITDVKITNASGSVIWDAAGGVVSLAWCSLNPVSASPETPLLNIHFNINDMAVFNEGLQLSLTGENEIADNDARAIEGLQLNYPEIMNVITSVADHNTLSFYASASPNPAGDYTVLEYSVAESGSIKYSIYSPLGILVKDPVIRNLEAGRYEEVISTSGLVSGFYFIRVEYEGRNDRNSAILKILIL